MIQITGVTYPIPKQYIERFFTDRKNVFIKPATTFKYLKSGMSFVFYQSREDTGYIGEARINNILYDEDPHNFFKIYNDRIFLTFQEVNDYIEHKKKWKFRVRKAKNPKKTIWMAIELEQIRKYSAIQKPPQFIPVGGKYLTEEVS